MRRLRRRLLPTLLLSAATLFSGCAAAKLPGSGADAMSAQSLHRALPLNHFAWSRAVQTDKDGFYYQPAGLADDYPTESRTPEKIRHDLETMQAAGVHQFRCAIGWDTLEEEPGKFDFSFWDQLVDMAPKYGVTLIPYVCYTPRWLGKTDDNYWREAPKDLKHFGVAMEAIAGHYKGKIKSWELWNEPDNQAYWLGNVDQFASMMIEGAKGVRKADPSAVLVLGGMSTGRGPFYDTLMTKYRMADYFDVINVHGYNETWDENRTEQYPERIDSMADQIPKNGPELWMAEFGYSDYRFAKDRVSQWGISVLYDYEHTPAYQAVSLFKAHVLALASGRLGLTTWYRINDLQPAQNVIGDDNNKFLGVLDVKGQPKPAFYALRFYNQAFDQPSRLADSRVKVSKPAGSQSVLHVFEKKDGSLVVTGWLRSSTPGEVADKSGMAKDTRQETVSVQLPGTYSKLSVHGAQGEAIANSAAHLDDNVLSGVTLRGDQAFVALLSR